MRIAWDKKQLKTVILVDDENEMAKVMFLYITDTKS